MRFKNIFYNSIPVAIGYLFIGFTFGILWVQKGGNPFTSFLFSFFVYTGAAQFMALEFIGTPYNKGLLFISILILNIRMIFYGFYCLKLFGPWSFKKVYMISTMTDESFGMIQFYKKKNMFTTDILFKVFLLNHFYWVSACVLGAYVSSFYSIQIKGLDFSLIALFIVMSLEGFKK